ncbi:DUF1289 domain-containing protein [Rheinheimera aquimaris]|uniref:DUF1289 domain-containing protein n=1 Tax=Rheinheimera aquimaris TaxID=412437 RepID=UPI001CFF9ECE|nr:DUF1289 domain-containing protein [Rheinheimera aquimaris]MCB5215348.1 DUF1289 domain-containing protein [Rheinheimera aquimaris]
MASCRLNNDKYCVGCLRHIAEIVDWNKRTDEENAAILHKVAKRKQVAAFQSIVEGETYPITQAEWQAAKSQKPVR